MSALLVALIAGALVVAYRKQDDPFLLTIAVAVATLAAPALIARFVTFRRPFFRATLLASTIYRRRTIRVSLSYLVAIKIKNEQLLVRGKRIRSQYQPVGGVFKVHPGTDALRKLGARPDTRFKNDPESDRDLRLLLPGKNLHLLLQWFTSRSGRELFPWREFYEELIRPGYLPADKFAYFDCAYRGIFHLPLRFDKYSQHQQLILSELYELLPTPEQQRELEELYDRVKAGAVDGVTFATSGQIERGGALDSQDANCEIPPTARWLVADE